MTKKLCFGLVVGLLVGNVYAGSLSHHRVKVPVNSENLTCRNGGLLLKLHDVLVSSQGCDQIDALLDIAAENGGKIEAKMDMEVFYRPICYRVYGDRGCYSGYEMTTKLELPFGSKFSGKSHGAI